MSNAAPTLTPAQHTALKACVAQVDATEARLAKANAAGCPVSLLTDRTSVACDCDERCAGCLVAAGCATWAWGFEGHSTIHLTARGFTTASK